MTKRGRCSSGGRRPSSRRHQRATPARFPSRKSSVRSTWRSRFDATGTSRPNSTRSAAVLPSATRRFSPPRTASPTRISAAFRPTSSPVPSTVRRRRSTRSSRSVAFIVRRPATTTRTCSCPRSASGCGRRRSGDASAHRPTRSIPLRCSIGCRKSRHSSVFSSARFRARRASRSKGSTCSCPCSTK